VTLSAPAKGAIAGAVVALVWVEWGFAALVFVLFAALVGALVAATVTGRWDPRQALRDLQERP
jgi:hypothetical protein